MKLFAALAIASANAISCSVCEETTVQTLSSDFTTVKNPIGHLSALNGCFQGGSNNGLPVGTCEGTCFALFFAYKGLIEREI
jgi:hypothetical protein